MPGFFSSYAGFFQILCRSFSGACSAAFRDVTEGSVAANWKSDSTTAAAAGKGGGGESGWIPFRLFYRMDHTDCTTLDTVRTLAKEGGGEGKCPADEEALVHGCI